MPQIREYTPQVAPAGPAGIARVEDPGAAGRGLRNLGLSLAGLGDAMHRRDEERDEAALISKSALLRAQATIDLQEQARTADPNNTEAVDRFAENFQARLGDQLDGLSEGLRTQRGRDMYEQVRAKLTAEMAERAYVHQAALGGKRDRLNVEKAKEAFGTVLRNDPTQFDSSVEEMHALIEAQGYLTAVDREELKLGATQELAVDAVRGFIAVNPEATRKRLAAGDWNDVLRSEDKDVLIGEAEQALRAQDAEAERIRVRAERVLKESQKATADSFISKLDKNELTAREVLDSNLDPTGENSKEHWLKVLKQRNTDLREPVKTVPSEFSKVLEDIRRGRIKSVTDIEKYYTVKGTISWEDIKELRREWDDLLTPDGRRLSDVQQTFLKGIKPQIDKSNPLLGKIDHVGAEKYAQFEMYAMRKVQEYREANKDPYDLFDQSKPDYLGKQIASFRTPITESVQRIRENMAPAASKVEPRREGESAADYLKRTEGK